MKNTLLLWWSFLLWMLIAKMGSVLCAPGARGGGQIWRRPVPGWRQSEESVALENLGFGFEEAEFEVHFRDQGMLFYYGSVEIRVELIVSSGWHSRFILCLEPQ